MAPAATETPVTPVSPSERIEGPIDAFLTGLCKFPPLPNLKTILVTGGAGFIGSWVTRHLVRQYAETYNVICLDKMDVVASLNNILDLFTCTNFRFLHCDLNDQHTVLFALQSYSVDCVLHFAASSHVQNSFNDPFTFTQNNVLGTQSLLEAVRSYGKIQRFIHVSTDEVYGETNGQVAMENSTPMRPTNPYSASKAAAEMYAMAYQKSFGLPIIIVRSNNVYGPGQYPEKIIPRFAGLMLKGQNLTLQGNGDNARRFLYGADAADAFDTILHKGEIGEIYNVDSSYEVSNRKVAAMMLALFGHDPVKDFGNMITWLPDRPFNDNDYAVDGNKLQALGWKQRINFDSGLEMTVDWYKKNMATWWHCQFAEDGK
ncbi:dTDP-D-glucose 4-6-dehydratase [Penicillium cosmopolitanum]|uniref:dTDP-D-glucose 4-6-dehydratase n=1 Tax=Penicillium cosmopolitanum TaxID=1131564 RepID=A0A9W9SH57_9EURO|nr:dTDP-D-glucose 4-6-dehydratase [Penicillium cosmopolitanum]KAJ5378513.1 dTDP-D-glucose 4-6-dehydratase [Penicillium cosmopolitanum]